MTTAADIVTRSLKRLRILAPGETPAAADAEDGLAALNAMIASWETDGISVAADLPLDDRFEQGLVAMLAVRLAPDYGIEPAASLLRDAEEGRAAITAAFLTVPRTQFDVGLTRSSTQNTPYACAPPEQWAPAAAYEVGDIRQWQGKLYECVIPGTSAHYGGPLGFESAITDGTVVWSFIRVL